MAPGSSPGGSPGKRRRLFAGAALLAAALLAVMVAAEPFGKQSGGASEVAGPAQRGLIQTRRLTATNRVQTWRSRAFGARVIYAHVQVLGRELTQSMLGPCNASYVGRQVVAVLDVVNCRGRTGPAFIRLHYANLGHRRRLTVHLTSSAAERAGTAAAGGPSPAPAPLRRPSR